MLVMCFVDFVLIILHGCMAVKFQHTIFVCTGMVLHSFRYNRLHVSLLSRKRNGKNGQPSIRFVPNETLQLWRESEANGQCRSS